MGTRTVQLDEEVYERIEAAQRDDETVSEAISRLMESASLRDLIGTLSDSEAAEMRDGVAASRQADLEAEYDQYEESS